MTPHRPAAARRCQFPQCQLHVHVRLTCVSCARCTCGCVRGCECGCECASPLHVTPLQPSIAVFSDSVSWPAVDRCPVSSHSVGCNGGQAALGRERRSLWSAGLSERRGWSGGPAVGRAGGWAWQPIGVGRLAEGRLPYYCTNFLLIRAAPRGWAGHLRCWQADRDFSEAHGYQPCIAYLATPNKNPGGTQRRPLIN